MPIREQSRSGNCLSRLPSSGRRRPRCFASATTTHRVASSSARSAPLPSLVSVPLTKLPSGEPGGSARREARWRSKSYIQVGRRGNAVGSCRRRHWPRLGPARESKRTKVCHAPLRRGAPRDRGRIRERRGAHPRPLLRGKPLGGRVRSPDPSPHRRPRRKPPRVRSDPGTRHSLRGRRDTGPGRDAREGADSGLLQPDTRRARAPCLVGVRSILGVGSRGGGLPWCVATSG